MTVPKGLLLTGDLLFSSRVTGTATAVGGAMDVAGDVDSALDREGVADYRCVILDLAMPGSVQETVDRLRAAGCAPPVVAFGSHVQTQRLQEAIDAGCAEVLPRSRFTENLPELLKKYLRSEQT